MVQQRYRARFTDVQVEWQSDDPNEQLVIGFDPALELSRKQFEEIYVPILDAGTIEIGGSI